MYGSKFTTDTTDFFYANIKNGRKAYVLSRSIFVKIYGSLRSENPGVSSI